MSLFGPEHERFRKETRRLIEQHLAPRADEWEQPGAVTKDVFRMIGSFGWFGLSVPKEYGGSGLDFAYDVVLCEELPRSRMMGLASSINVQSGFVIPLLVRHGTREQRAQFLPGLLSGEKVASIGVTEPTGGTDLVRSVQCTARDGGDFWVISGEKKFITNGPIADYVFTLVRTSRSAHGTTGFSIVVVPTDVPGFEVVATLRTMGMRSSPTGWLRFHECRVPKSYTIGKPHMGLLYIMNGLHRERLTGAAGAISLAGMALEETIRRVQQRHLFERPLGELQAVRHRIAEMAAQVECCRRFVHSVAESFRDGRIEANEICMIKFLVMETVQRVVEQCAQLHGAEGYLDDHWLARAYRDVRMFTIGGGVSERMKDLVAGYLRI